MPSPSIIDPLRSGDRAAIAELLSDDVAFHSPVADYRGREEVVHLLATISTVIDDIRVRRELGDGRETVAFVDGEVGGQAIEGVVDQIRDGAGRVCDITLMLRPLDALRAAVKRMAAALAT